jgi:TctA family transporter
MKTEKLAKVRFEKNVIAGAVIGSWGWNTPGAGCEVQAQSSKNTAQQDVKKPAEKK